MRRIDAGALEVRGPPGLELLLHAVLAGEVRNDPVGLGREADRLLLPVGERLGDLGLRSAAGRRLQWMRPDQAVAVAGPRSKRGSGRPTTSRPPMTSSAPSRPASRPDGLAPIDTTYSRSRSGPPKVTSVGLRTGTATVRSSPPVVNRASWLPPTSAHQRPPSASSVAPSGRP